MNSLSGQQVETVDVHARDLAVEGGTERGEMRRRHMAVERRVVLPAFDHHEAVRGVARGVQVVLQATGFGAARRDDGEQGGMDCAAVFGLGGDGGNNAEGHADTPVDG